jgi:hypothetical protein
MAMGVAQPARERPPSGHHAPATCAGVVGSGSLMSSMDQDQRHKLERTTGVMRASEAGSRLTKWRRRLGAAELGGKTAFLDGWSRLGVVDGHGELQQCCGEGMTVRRHII